MFSCENSIDFWGKKVNFWSDSSREENKKNIFAPEKNPTVLAKVIWWWREDYCKVKERKDFQRKAENLCYKNNYNKNSSETLKRVECWDKSVEFSSWSLELILSSSRLQRNKLHLQVWSIGFVWIRKTIRDFVSKKLGENV